jgi:ABC-type polysaccharide transport system permease subunit
MYFCGASISGPWYEFKDFQNYMSGKEHYKTIPNTLLPTLVRVFHVILMIAASIILSEYFDEKYYLTLEF